MFVLGVWVGGWVGEKIRISEWMKGVDGSVCGEDNGWMDGWMGGWVDDLPW